MSDLTVQSQEPSDSDLGLTAYKVDGLELFFTKNRKVRASQSAIARMCNVTETTIRNDLKTLELNGTILDVVYAKGRSMTEEVRSKLHNSSTIKILLKKRNPARLEQFLDFGIDEGLAQMAGVPLPQATPQFTTTEFLQMGAKALMNMAAITEHGDNNPGFKREIDSVLERDGKVISGSMTIREMSILRKVAMTKGQAQAVGRLMADAYKTRKELPLAPKVKSSYKQPNGNYQCVWVGSYPIEMLSVFDSACSAFGVLSLSDSE